MSIEDRRKHLKSPEEIKEELVNLLIKSGASEKTVEAARNAKTKIELEQVKRMALTISSLIHDEGHPYIDHDEK